jgi:hypothetical protein
MKSRSGPLTIDLAISLLLQVVTFVLASQVLEQRSKGVFAIAFGLALSGAQCGRIRKQAPDLLLLFSFGKLRFCAEACARRASPAGGCRAPMD